MTTKLYELRVYTDAGMIALLAVSEDAAKSATTMLQHAADNKTWLTMADDGGLPTFAVNGAYLRGWYLIPVTPTPQERMADALEKAVKPEGEEWKLGT